MRTSIRRALLRWYRVHLRDLPWRCAAPNLPDPYRVLVSEAMLQQTQVATVIDYFNRFMCELPSVRHLAKADEQQVLRLWQGLGYYRRARHLHRAARQIMTDHDGHVPDTVESLLKLPGVGRYTAGAIASIAFGRSAPIVDGNVARVLARLLAIRQSVDEPQTRETIWQHAAELVPDGRRARRAPGDFNQAMMELGATICTPKQPACPTCPLRRSCAAYAKGCVAQLPITGKRTAPKPVTHRIFAIERRHTLLFEQRPDTGLWAGLWQMPTLEDDRDPDNWAETHLGLALNQLKKIGQFEHLTTHRRIQFELWHATARGRLRRHDSRWRRYDDVDDLPLANPQRKALRQLAPKA